MCGSFEGWYRVCGTAGTLAVMAMKLAGSAMFRTRVRLHNTLTISDSEGCACDQQGLPVSAGLQICIHLRGR